MSDGEERRMTILEFLRREGPATTDQIVTVLQLSKTATRAHLNQLEEEGAIASDVGESTGRGRPPLVYSLTEEGGLRFPTQDGQLLTELLEFLKKEGHRALVERFFSDLWTRRLELFERKLADGSLSVASRKERVRALEQLLEDTGFMPEITRDGATLTVQECNCPISAAARATRIPCKLEARFLQRVVGGELVHATFAARRTENCHFEFDLSAD